MNERLASDTKLNLPPEHDGSAELRGTEATVHALRATEAELRNERHASEVLRRALIAANARYSALYHRAPVAFCTVDRAGRIHELNAAAALLFGRTGEEVVGKPLLAVLTRVNAEALARHLRSCVDGDDQVTTDVQAELRGVRRSLRLVSWPLDPHPGNALFHTAIVDLTAEKSTRTRLELLSSIFVGTAATAQDALENAADALFAEFCEAVVLTTDELSAVRRGDEADHVEPPAVAAEVAGLLANEISQLGEAPVVLRRPPVSATLGLSPKAVSLLAPVASPGRARRGWLVLARDRSVFTAEDVAIAGDVARRIGQTVELHSLVARLRREGKIREDLLSLLSHDVVNAAAGIKLSLESWSGDGNAAEPRRVTRAGLERVLASVDFILSLVRKLLDLGAIEAGTFLLDARPERVSALLEHARPVLEEMAIPRGVRLDIHLVADSMVRANVDRITQVLTNLVGNAVKFSPRGGRVVVEGRRVAQGGAVISVRDSGPGVPPEDRAHLFDRYFRPARGGRGGAGLGLWISKAIVEAHGGKIWCETDPARGSEFSFTLPSDAGPAAGNGPPVLRKEG